MEKNKIQGMDPIRTVQVLRKGIGSISIAMPFLLIILSLIPFFEVNKIQISLSAYYYTNIREVFTGILCIVGFFLLLYQSDYKKPSLRKKENLFVKIMGVSSIAVALVPTDCKENDCSGMPSFIPHVGETVALIHTILAAILFLTFAYFSYKIFPVNQDTSIDVKNSRIYKLCSLVIVFAVVLLFLNFKFNFFSHMTLVSEIIILLSFGYSWFTKGKNDSPIISN